MSLLMILDDESWYQIQFETLAKSYTNYLICIFMNINENIRNKRKLVEMLRGYNYKITTISAASYHILQDLVPNKI